MAVTANSPNRESRFILLTGFAELYRYNCFQSSKEALVFFLGGFLTSRFGAFLFAILKVYAIGQAVQGRWIKLTNTLNADAARFRFVRNPTRIGRSWRDGTNSAFGIRQDCFSSASAA